MKAKLILSSVAVIALSLMIITQQVGAGDELPRLTVVCESKNGDLYSVGDEFAKREECKNSGRLVVLGEKPVSGGGNSEETGDYLGLGEIAFFNPINSSLLKRNGTSWSVLYTDNGPAWVQDDTKRNIPETISIDDMVAWDKSYFLLKSGEVYMFQFDKWVSIGHP